MTEPAGSQRARSGAASADASRGEAEPDYESRRRAAIGRSVVGLALLVTGVVLILTIGISKPDRGEKPDDDSFRIVQLRPEPDSRVPRSGLPAPVDRPHASDAKQLAAWASQVAEVTDIPARALEAYGRTEMWLRSESPRCRLAWTTLAGIGRAESRHGGFSGSRIDDKGDMTRPVFGPALDGAPGLRKIGDTDRGKLDGDTKWDRAVGPMQFLPETWLKWRARASRDGDPPDPQNIDDAALTAGRFLCGEGDDVATREGWWRAVMRYNDSVAYTQDVFSGAEAYALASDATTVTPKPSS